MVEEEEEKGKKIRNKGNVTTEPSERHWEAPKATWSVPGKWGFRKAPPDVKLTLAANSATKWLIFRMFSKYVCKTPCTVFKKENAELLTP